MKKSFLAMMLILPLILGISIYHVVADSLKPVEHTYSKPLPCPANPSHTYEVDILNDKLTKSSITAHRCDRLIIKNLDNGVHRPALGPHNHHIDYPGFEETILVKNNSISVILSQTGSYALHDHFNEGDRTTLTIQ